MHIGFGQQTGCCTLHSQAKTCISKIVMWLPFLNRFAEPPSQVTPLAPRPFHQHSGNGDLAFSETSLGLMCQDRCGKGNDEKLND